jgi:hypothetical protein
MAVDQKARYEREMVAYKKKLGGAADGASDKLVG